MAFCLHGYELIGEILNIAMESRYRFILAGAFGGSMLQRSILDAMQGCCGLTLCRQ
jgi:hypothetical protein